MAAPRRNIELKASDPDPERSLAVGARPRRPRSRAPAPARHLLPRHDGPPEAPRGGAGRRDADPVRPRRRRRGAREPLPARSRSTTRGRCAPRWRRASARSRWSRRSATCCCWQNVRIHLDHVKDLGNFVELEGVATRGLRPRRRARARHPPDRGARDRARAHPAQLLLRPGRRLVRAGARRPAR